MNYLIHCACSHTVDAHTEHGCRGERGESCSCPRTPSRALDAAIDQARQHPWSVDVGTASEGREQRSA